jgi:transposase-like protein
MFFKTEIPENCIKCGKSNSGIQRYKDLKTKRVYQETTTRLNPVLKYLCVYLYFNGMSYRKISGMFGVSFSSVRNWVKIFSNEVKNNFKLSETQDVKEIEIDELYTYIFKKKLNLM